MINKAIRAMTGKEWEWHSSVFTDHDLIVIYRGKGWLSYDRHTIELEEGDLIHLIPGHQYHMYQESDALMRQYAIHYDWNHVCEYVSWIKPDQVQQWRVPDFDLIRKLTERVVRYYARRQPRRRDMTQANLWFEVLMRELKHQVQEQPQPFTDLMDRLGVLMDRIENYGSQHWRVEQMAEELQITRSYLTRIFKQEIGQTPSHYLQQVRAQAAKNQLQYSRDSLSQIAEKLGFSDVYHFGKSFKTHVGMSPGQYRKTVNP